MTYYLPSMDNISLSRTVLEIFDFKDFRVWPWSSTPKSHLGSNNFVPFESPYMTFYLTSIDNISPSRTVFEIFDFKVLGFDLDLWPRMVIWGQKTLNHSRAHIWLAIWPLWTPSFYLVPFSRYSTSKFLGFDFNFWPLRSSGIKKFYTIRKPIYDFLFDFYGHHLSISYRFRDNAGQNFEGRTKWRILTF